MNIMYIRIGNKKPQRNRDIIKMYYIYLIPIKNDYKNVYCSLQFIPI